MGGDRREPVVVRACVREGRGGRASRPTGGFLFKRMLQPYVRRVLGKSVYDDMRRLEDLAAASEVDWTVLRPSGLLELPEVTDFSITEEHGPGRFTSRQDLAAAMLQQVTDARFVRKVVHMI